MRPRIIILFCFLLICMGICSQTYNKQKTYLDALELATIRRTIDSIEIRTIQNDEQEKEYWTYVLAYERILGKYVGNKWGDGGKLKGNPFLYDMLYDEPFFTYTSSKFGDPERSIKSPISYLNIQESESDKIIKELKITQNQPQLVTTSVNWQASAINGISNFMAGRFKQEVLQVAIDQFFNKVNGHEKAKIVEYIFPKTFKLVGDLSNSNSAAYYTADLLLLREAAQIDMENLPKNMPIILTNYSDFIFPKGKDNPEFKLGKSILVITQQSQPIDSLFSSLSNELNDTPELNHVFNLADLLSQALRAEEGSTDMFWIPKRNNVEKLTYEEKFFYGLIYEQLKVIPGVNLPKEADRIIDLILSYTDFANDLNKICKLLERKKNKLTTPNDYIIYLQSVNQIATKVLEELPTNSNNVIKVSEVFVTIIDFVTTGLKTKKDYQRIIPQLVIEFGQYIDMKEARMLTFISQLALIEEDKDMENLLNAYALPIGGSSIKRSSKFNITLNGYVGLTGGWETVHGSTKSPTAGNIGLSAPIGVSATFLDGYLTPFVSFIDLGTIVNRRLNNDNTSYSNLKLEHFFSPGFGLYFNCPKLPITVGIHYNYIPNLKTIQYNDGIADITETKRSVSRINFSILVDIPFFTLYNKTK